MSRTVRPGLARLIPTLALLLAVVPACTASAGHKFLGGRGGAGTAPGRVAYRPIFPPSNKQFFLGGYAGAVYPPLGAGRGFKATSYNAAPGFHPASCPCGAH